jgi:hypothetical protein
MVLILWILLCVVGAHFLADNFQHGGMVMDVGFPASQSASETFDEHQLETAFILPDGEAISCPLALMLPSSPDRAFLPLLIVLPLLNPPRA